MSVCDVELQVIQLTPLHESVELLSASCSLLVQPAIAE